jgi:hypothetical protein
MQSHDTYRPQLNQSADTSTYRVDVSPVTPFKVEEQVAESKDGNEKECEKTTSKAELQESNLVIFWRTAL